MAWVIWREGEGKGREYLAGFGRGRGGTVQWTADRDKAREFPDQRDAIDARDRITNRIGLAKA